MLKKTGFLKTLRNQTNIVFNSAFLKNLTHTETYEFLQLCHRRVYQDGEMIYHIKDPGNGFYMIESGSVELFVQNEKGTQIGSSFRLSSPDTFGNLSLAHSMRRMSSARAVGETIVLGFFKPDFAALEKRYPQIAIKLLSEINRVIAQQLESTMLELANHIGEYQSLYFQAETFYTQNSDAPVI